METISRRVFLKSSVSLGATLVLGKYLNTKGTGFTDLLKPAHAGQGAATSIISVVSDVDAHSQCRMLVRVKEGKVTALGGDSADPETKGALTVRDEHMKEVLYAPDRLKYPLRRAGARGEGKWERISWEEALSTIAERLHKIKKEYGPEAIDILMAITGNLDVRGGNVIIIPIVMGLEDIKLFEKLPPEAAQKKLGADKCLYSRISKAWPSAHTPALWGAILHGEPYPVKAMLVMASNPLLTCANSNVVEQALKKLDFFAVADIFMTPTARLADILLPACTFLEKTRFVTYDTHADHSWNVQSRIVLSPRAVEPLEESWSDWKIICGLGRKMGYGEYFPWRSTPRQLPRSALRSARW